MVAFVNRRLANDPRLGFSDAVRIVSPILGEVQGKSRIAGSQPESKASFVQVVATVSGKPAARSVHLPLHPLLAPASSGLRGATHMVVLGKSHDHDPEMGAKRIRPDVAEVDVRGDREVLVHKERATYLTSRISSSVTTFAA